MNRYEIWLFASIIGYSFVLKFNITPKVEHFFVLSNVDYVGLKALYRQEQREMVGMGKPFQAVIEKCDCL